MIILKFIAVCNFGCGSSLILKMTLDKVIAQLGIDAEADNIDQASIRGMQCDAVFTSEELAAELAPNVKFPVIAIKKYMDLAEVKEAVRRFMITRK